MIAGLDAMMGWKRLAPALSDFVRTQLEPMVEQIRLCQQHLQRLSGQIEAFVAHEKLPVGLGALTMSLADGEVCDWHRFKHLKAPSSYTGCCPSEYSSGGIQRTGSIDRHGNKLLRLLLIEAVWRLLRLQPNWHAYKKLMIKIKAGAVIRKKMAVALARQPRSIFGVGDRAGAPLSNWALFLRKRLKTTIDFYSTPSREEESE